MSLLNDKTKPEACRVCGETNSAGWHCGTITCEACKKFYLRNAKSEYLEFKCIRSNMNCVITKSTRTNCAYCRFQKCIQVGMKQNEKSSNDTVPFKEIPCTVCGDSSSGLHFGAITCEGCKGFFRRNVKEGHKFVCTGNGQCEISYKSRNACRSCRYKRCIHVGMDLKNCKIGRQSNLFKQKIKSIMDNKSDQCSSSSLKLQQPLIESSIVYQLQSHQHEHQLINSYSSNNELNSKLNSIEIEDSMEDKAKFLIKKIYQSYQVLESIPFLNQNKVINQEYELPFELIRIHTEQCVNFMSNISFLERFSMEDQKIILVNSVHLIRLIQIIRINHKREQNDSKAANTNMNNTILNYFDCDQQTHNKIIQTFPIFDKILVHLKHLSDFIKEFNLDSKEFAIYSAYLAFSASCNGLNDIGTKFDCILELCDLLTRYMYLRRNEHESCEQIVNICPRFERLNLLIQKGIYDKCLEIMKMGYQFDKFYETIFISQMQQYN